MNACWPCHLGCVYGLGQSKAGHRDTCWDQDGLNLQLRGRDNGHVQGNQGFKGSLTE